MKNVKHLYWLCTTVALVQAAEAQPPGLPSEISLLTRPFGAAGTSSPKNIALGQIDNPARLHIDSPAGYSTSTKYTYARHTGTPNQSGPYARLTLVKPRYAAEMNFIDITGQATLPNGVNLKLRESEPSFQAEYRLTKNISAGIAASYLNTKTRASLPALGGFFNQESVPRGIGGRFGLNYAVNQWLSLGAAFDRYANNVTTTPLGTFAPVGIKTDILRSRRNALDARLRLNKFNLYLSHTNASFTGGQGFSLDKNYTSLGISLPIKNASFQFGVSGDHYGHGGLSLAFKKWDISAAVTNINKIYDPTSQATYLAEARYRF